MTRRSRSKNAAPKRAAPDSHTAPQGAPAPTRRANRRGGCLLWLFRIFSVLVLGAALVFGALWLLWGRNLPSVADLDVLELSGQTRVYDRTGVLVGTLTPSLSSGSRVNRDLLKLADINPNLQKAVVTSEDRRFYEHHGVDYLGIVRGLLKGLFRNDLEGGSSITQQVVKNTLLADLHSARTPERKFKEAVLAYQLDRDFDKNQILNAYLNIVYWGDGGRDDIVGAGSASRAYFKKDARDLNLAESVYLATIIPAPNRRYRDFKSYRPLMKDLLGRMVEDRRITQAQADAAWKTPIYPAGWRIAWNVDGSVKAANLERQSRLQENLDASADTGSRYQYQSYLQAVEKEMLTKVSRKVLYDGGKIYTGMDIQAQQAAEKASLDSRMPSGATMGIALVNPANGQALALVGQNLFEGRRPGDWNNATQARRQVGSSIKPLLYTLALQNGWKQDDTVLDSPIEGDYQPMNYDRRWTGRYVTMRYALDHSLNLPTVRIGQEVGMENFQGKLRELGLTPPPDAGLSLSIGTLEASPLQMAAAYAAFANGGIYYEPSLVRSFQDKSGKEIYAYKPVSRRVWDEQTAWLGLDMIRGVVNDLQSYQGGLATKARIDGWDVGGKTGTTNDIKDLWFAGVTPTVSGAVWVGKQEGGTLPSWAYSGDVPTPVWQQAVAGALQGRGKVSFKEPAGVTYRMVRRIKMAFLDKNADADPVAHDGSHQSQGGAVGSQTPAARNNTPANAPAPAPAPVTAPVLPDPATNPATDPAAPPNSSADSSANSVTLTPETPANGQAPADSRATNGLGAGQTDAQSAGSDLPPASDTASDTAPASNPPLPPDRQNSAADPAEIPPSNQPDYSPPSAPANP